MPKQTIRVELSRATLKAVSKEAAAKVVVSTTLKVHNRAKILAPVDTGNLRASIEQRITITGKEVIGRVGTNVKYALWVHEGTRPHKIQAKDAKALRFFWPKVGAVTIVPQNPTRKFTGYYAKGSKFYVGKGYVDHPGTKGRPFLRRALEQFGPKANFKVKR